MDEISLPDQVEDENEEESDDEMDDVEDGSTVVTKEMLLGWIKNLEKSPSINSLKDILLTFRAMSLMDEKYNASCRYQINSETGGEHNVSSKCKLWWTTINNCKH